MLQNILPNAAISHVSQSRYPVNTQSSTVMGSAPIYSRRLKQRRISSPKLKQTGVVLIISLILLSIMTILGLVTLSGTRLNAKASFNQGQKEMTFAVAESAISSVWDAVLLKETAISGSGDVVDSLGAVEFSEELTNISSIYDLSTTKGSVDVDGIITAQYCGETGVIDGSLNVDESSTRMVGMLIDVSSQVTIDSSNATTQNIQRGVITSIATGRSSNCTAP